MPLPAVAQLQQVDGCWLCTLCLGLLVGVRASCANPAAEKPHGSAGGELSTGNRGCLIPLLSFRILLWEAAGEGENTHGDE